LKKQSIADDRVRFISLYLESLNLKDASLRGVGSVFGRAPISSVSRYPKNVGKGCEAKSEAEESRGDRGGKIVVIDSFGAAGSVGNHAYAQLSEIRDMTPFFCWRYSDCMEGEARCNP
jgi:hypothetical protein